MYPAEDLPSEIWVLLPGVLVPLRLGGGLWRPLELPSSLLSRGLTFINTPGLLVLLGVSRLPPKGMDLAVIPVI